MAEVKAKDVRAMIARGERDNPELAKSITGNMLRWLVDALDRAERAEAGQPLDAYRDGAMEFALPECRQLVNAALGLTGEAGEFAEHVKKHLFQGRPLDKEKLAEELGDVLWYIALACTVLDVPLQTVANANLRKLHERYPNGPIGPGGKR